MTDRCGEHTSGSQTRYNFVGFPCKEFLGCLCYFVYQIILIKYYLFFLLPRLALFKFPSFVIKAFYSLTYSQILLSSLEQLHRKFVDIISFIEFQTRTSYFWSKYMIDI